MNNKILGVGSPIVDMILPVPDAFLPKYVSGQKGGMVLVDISVINDLIQKAGIEPRMVPGGSTGNSILTLDKLGVDTGFLGKLADDEPGNFYKNYHRNAGTDIRQFKISDKVQTARCLSLVTPDSERTMRTYLGAAATISPEDISDADFKGYSHLVIEGYMLHNYDVTRKILESAKRHNISVALDLASFEYVRDHKPILQELLASLVDIVFCNEDEATAFTRTTNPEDVLAALDGVCDIICLKLGKKGSVIKHGKDIVRVSAIPVKAVDTTGAGDIWQAGFMYGYVKAPVITSEALWKAGTYGSILASEVVQVMGAYIPDDKWNDIMDRINKV